MNLRNFVATSNVKFLKSRKFEKSPGAYARLAWTCSCCAKVS